MNDLIKKEISDQIDKKLLTALEIFSIPLKSQYRVFTFNGRADGTALSINFNLADYQNRYIVIKSIRFVPYSFGNTVDILFSDGTSETIPTNTRLTRVIDDFVVGTTINFSINGNKLFFLDGSTNGYPIDLFLDNIFYKVPERLQSIEISVNSRIDNDLLGALIAPNIKVVFECYVL
jgi:hypothetical protein